MIENDFEMERSKAEAPVVATRRQVTLMEILFATTLVAVSMGVYQYFGPIIAIFLAGGLMVIGSVRLWPPRNPLAGGIRGFVAASLIAWALFAELEISFIAWASLFCCHHWATLQVFSVQKWRISTKSKKLKSFSTAFTGLKVPAWY